ncbi:conserved hypothetical protein [Candidatus Desulfarcum epimagneticum]|uniref:Uncharacterized protein n=1 Tax=uncultured Desulfobacteraceae bacterium TaxID=218296 RepID=A0A484HM14_9BACT|nr:conserved hypothetical protein [uncultured Desulfobacteraceae bacterium]
MTHLNKLRPQYITDMEGRKISVSLFVEEFQNLLEDIQYLAIIAERREEPMKSHKDFMAELKKDGFI